MAILVWIGFLMLVLGILALDLGVFHRRDRAIGFRESMAWSVGYIALALLFNVLVFFLYERHWLGFGQWHGALTPGREAAVQFLTGYIIEKSLSLDNIFVIALIFAYFGVPLKFQHRVLFWGILGALVLRGVMIGLGAALIARFEWIIYVFGAILLVTALRMARHEHGEIHPERNPLLRAARRVFPVTNDFHGHSFFVKVDGRRAVTPLFMALLLVESADVVFAVDSIPAIFAVTRDPFIVFTSNVFAILGLRTLYFVLASLNARFRYLRQSLVALLAYVGVKMLLSHELPIPNHVSLIVIAGLMTTGIVASQIAASRERRRAAHREG